MIDKEKVYSYFDKFHGPITPSTNGWHNCKCPNCGKDKFALNFNYLVGKCWTGCYGTGSLLIDVIQSYHNISYFEARELVDSMEDPTLRINTAPIKSRRISQIGLPNGYQSILEGTTNLGYRAREYLTNRGFDLNYLDRIGVGYCIDDHEDPTENYFGYIIIPFKKNGILQYYIGRDFLNRGDFYRYKNPAKEKLGVGKMEIFFNEEALHLQKKVYITEGWACAATIGPRGMSQQGSVPSVIQRNKVMKSPVEEVIIVPDAGYYSRGLEAAREIMKMKPVKVVNLDQFMKDGIGKDVNEIGVENLYNQENKTQYMTPSFLFHQFKVYTSKRIVI